jgi:tRNA-dihydrouridine synthase B
MSASESLLLAPFKGITTKAWRNAFSRHFTGFDQLYAPFISGLGDTRVNPSKLQDIVPISDNLSPTIPQFISTNANEIILLGKTLQDYGYDHMNWNLGCPFTRIAEKFRGCGILPYPQMLDEILDEVFAKMTIKLSIKTRLGYKNPEEIYAILKILNKYPIHSIILHTRTGKQLYRGDTDPDAFAACRKISVHPMVYNGDIYNLPSFLNLKTAFPGLMTWMLGRGVLMNPFLAMEIKGQILPDSEKRKQLTAFHAELLESARQSIPQENKCLGWMKAIWYYMSGVFSDGDKIFRSIKQSVSFSEYLQSIEDAIDQPFSNYQQQEYYFKYAIKHV